MWLFRAVLFIVGFLAFIVAVGESTDVLTPWSIFALKIAAMGVIWAVYKVWWWSLSPAEKAEYEKEEA